MDRRPALTKGMALLALRRDVRGASGIEYAILAGMVAIVLGVYFISIQQTVYAMLVQSLGKLVP